MSDAGTDTGFREVAFDTETTGLDPQQGDRVVEICCVELVDLMPTGRIWHTYVNPERDMPEAARRVHGLTREFLSGHPKFAAVAQPFLAWIGNARLVAHNATFDFNFINAELARLRLPPLANEPVDTLAMARQAFPGAKISLNDLCRRFGIDLSKRTRHGAQVDTELLARVYLELRGGRHRKLDFGTTSAAPEADASRPWRAPRSLGAPSAADLERHGEFLKAYIKEPLWAAMRAEVAAEAETEAFQAPCPGM